MQTSARAYSSTEGWHSCRVNFLSCMALNLSWFFWTVRAWCRQVYYQGNKSSASVMDPRPVNQKCLLMTWTENPKVNPIIFQTLRWKINAASQRKNFRTNFKCEQTLTVFCMSVWVNRVCALRWIGPGYIFASPNCWNGLQHRQKKEAVNRMWVEMSYLSLFPLKMVASSNWCSYWATAFI